MPSPLLSFTEKGIYCQQADVFIDPHHPVDRAIITHAHSDHARRGSQYYLAQSKNESILRLRLGKFIQLQTLAYNHPLSINGVKISFHPAGHIWGSSQVRLEYRGEVWAVSGDYKLEPDGFSDTFEPVVCNHFITESTFGLPIFNWDNQSMVFGQINQWWRKNAAAGKVSVLTAYSLGKAQRLIVNLDHSIGKVLVHESIADVNEALVNDGAILPKTYTMKLTSSSKENAGVMIIAPPAAIGSKGFEQFMPYEVAQVSGWMMTKGLRQKRNAKHAFVLSDHADWRELNRAVELSQAENIYVTHGYKNEFARWLRERGYNAQIVSTSFGGSGAD